MLIVVYTCSVYMTEISVFFFVDVYVLKSCFFKTIMSFSLDCLAPENRSRRRLQFAPAPLQGKSFFLHVQSASKARELEKKLKELGGVST